MTRELTRTDAGDAYIQFRGRQTSVSLDDAPVRFSVEEGPNGRRSHAPLPVTEPDAEDPPENAVRRDLAEYLVETNPLVCWGVACEAEECEEVFVDPQALNGHMGKHRADDGAEETEE